jgi:hypothetical protein
MTVSQPKRIFAQFFIIASGVGIGSFEMNSAPQPLGNTQQAADNGALLPILVRWL